MGKYDVLLEAAGPRRKYDALLDAASQLDDTSGARVDEFGAKASDTFPQERTESAVPRYVPPELLQAEEQAAIEQQTASQPVPEWMKQVVPQALKFPGKLALAAGAMQTGRLHWPTDEEVSTPAITPEQMKMAMPYAYIADAAKMMFPENKAAQIAAGVTGGMTDAMSGFTSPENLATLPFAPAGKLAQRAIAGTFLGQAISGTPEQWEAFNNAPNLTDKIRIATSMGLGYALPALGAAATFRKPGPKIVEPVKTTQEAASSGEVPSTAPAPSEVSPVAEFRPDLARIDQIRPQSDQLPQTLPKAETELVRPVVEPSDLPSQLRSQPETIPPRPAEASPKVASVPVMITKQMEADLRAHGITEEQIYRMTPAEAHEILSQPESLPRTQDLQSPQATDQFAQDVPVSPAQTRQGSGKAFVSSRPIEPGVEAAIAEIQRRNAPEPAISPVESKPESRPETQPNLGQSPETVSSELRPLGNEPIPSRLAQSRPEIKPTDDLRNRYIDIDENPPGPTSTKNAVTTGERETRGIPAAEDAARRDFGTVWDEAEAVAKTDVEAPRRLVAEISENPRALTDKENALLLRRQIEVQNEHAAAIEAVNSAPGDTAALSRLETARNELQTVYDAAKSAGTETGRGLNARKMLANQDFSLAKMEAETRAVVNEGKPLSPKQANEVRSLHARIAHAEAKVAAYEARETFNTELRQARKAGVRPDTFLDQQAQKARERIIARRGKLFADPIGVTQIAHLADEAIIGAAHIARGVRNFGDWSKTMISEFGERIKPYLQALYQRAQSLHSETAKRAVVSPGERLARALEGDKSRIRTNIAKIEAKTAARDFEPAPKSPPRMDKEKANLLFEYQKAKEAYTRGLFQAKLDKQSAPRKALRYGGEVLNTMRALMTSFDLSAVLRQGGFVTLGHPIRAAKSLPAMFKAFASEKAQFRINEEIRNRPNAPLYRQSKLYLADESVNSLSKMEEAYMSRWASKIPIVSGSQRAYTTFLNKLRADSFDTMVETLGRRGRVTTPEAQAIANFVNVATGRGNMGGAAQAAVGLNTVFFAPRYVLSRFQLLAGQPLYGGSLRTRVAVAKEYGRMLAGLAAVYTLAKSAGAEVESDSRSSDFGKLRFGDTRVDPLFGLAQSSVLLSRLGSGETKNLKGKILPIRGEKVPYGSGNSADVIARFLRTKLSPSFGGAVDIMAGKNVIGEPATPLSTAIKMVVPLSFGDIYNAMKDQGVEKGTAFAMLAMFGMGVQHYSPRVAKPKSERRKTLEEAMAELRQGKIKEFLTGK